MTYDKYVIMSKKQSFQNAWTLTVNWEIIELGSTTSQSITRGSRLWIESDGTKWLLHIQIYYIIEVYLHMFIYCKKCFQNAWTLTLNWKIIELGSTTSQSITRGSRLWIESDGTKWLLNIQVYYIKEVYLHMLMYCKKCFQNAWTLTLIW